MKKECTCYKIVKDDKVTLITECDLCKKNRRKELKLAIELVGKLIELKNMSIQIPEYKKESPVVSDDKKQEIIINQSIVLPKYTFMDSKQEQFELKIKSHLKEKGVVQNNTSLKEHWNMVLKKDPALKKAIEDLENKE